MQKVRKAVIPAAGFGTRFLPATKAMPKEMLPVVDIPTIQYIVEEIRASGIEQILIISGHAKRAIEDHFDSSPELENHLYQAGKLEQLRPGALRFWASAISFCCCIRAASCSSWASCSLLSFWRVSFPTFSI